MWRDGGRDIPPSRGRIVARRCGPGRQRLRAVLLGRDAVGVEMLKAEKDTWQLSQVGFETTEPLGLTTWQRAFTQETPWTRAVNACE
jgi:hypothetical protein